MPRTRVALYSHDTVGLGHTRRQLAIAEQIVRTQPEADLLLVTGNPEASRLPIPQRTDLLTLPTVTKNAEGDYVPRRMGTSLEDVVALRSAVITAGLDAFDPDLLIVDKVAGGLQGELRPALELLQGRTRMVLGLREILDSPAAPARVLSFRFTPAVTAADLRAAVGAGPDGLVLECYGSGNAPMARPGMLGTLREICGSLPVVAVTQCATGGVDLARYAVGRELAAAGAIDGSDLTVEAATAKLGFLLDRGHRGAELRGLMEQNLVGELTR